MSTEEDGRIREFAQYDRGGLRHAYAIRYEYADVVVFDGLSDESRPVTARDDGDGAGLRAQLFDEEVDETAHAR